MPAGMEARHAPAGARTLKDHGQLPAAPLRAALLALVLALASFGVAGAQQGQIELTTPYPSVLVDQQNRISFSIAVENVGATGQRFGLEVAEAPDGWETQLESRGLLVREVYLEPGQAETVNLTVFTPPEGVAMGDYNLVVRALDEGLAELASLNLTVGLQDEPVSGSVSLATEYPMVQGAANGTFVFKADLANDHAEELGINLSAVAPPGWQVSFKPAFEDREITSVTLEAGESQTIDVEVAPQSGAPPGEYELLVQAEAAGERAEAELQVALTADYNIHLDTATGSLSAQATPGQFSSFGLLVVNAGTGDLQEVSLTATEPEGWEVLFEPEAVPVIGRNALENVNVNVRPPSDAPGGDYLVTLTASNPEALQSVDMRVTVESTSAWGWLVAAVIAVTLGGLYVIFRTMGAGPTGRVSQQG